MKLHIQNFRRIKHADIDINTVTLIAGQNEQGKTSASQALAALATSNISVMGVTKKDSGLLVNKDATESLIMLTDTSEENNIQMTWPNAKNQAVGMPPKASPYATGLKRFGTTDPKEATKMLVELLKAYPTKEETMVAISEFTSMENTEKVWGVIDRDGWDTAQKFYQEQCRNLKSDWRSITAEEWGAAKAQGWTPQILPEITGADDKGKLTRDLQECERKLEESIANRAVDVSNMDALRAEVATLDNLRDQKKAKDDEIAVVQAEYDQVAKELSDIPELVAPIVMACPHCQKGIVAKRINSGTTQFVKEEDVKFDPKVLEENRQKNASLSGRLSNLKTQLGKLTSDLQGIKIKGNSALAAKEKLRVMEEAPKNGVGADVVQAAREAKATAEAKVKAFEAWEKATAIHKRIVAGLSIAELLGPDKLRKDAVSRKTMQFNDNYLTPLSNSFGINVVSINENLAVQYKGYGYALLSESAKFRVDCVMQAAIAKLDGSDVIVVDGADVIVGADRGNLLTMLHKNGIPALVTVSMASPEKCPDLSGIGGSVYWMQDGVTTRLGS